MLRKSVTITRASALEFRVPSSRGTRAARSDAYDLMIQLDGAARGRTVRGVGAAGVHRRATELGQQRSYWDVVQSALDQVEGASLPAHPPKALALLGEIADGLRESIPGERSPGEHAVLAAVDVALADVAAQAKGISMAAFLGGRRGPLPTGQVFSARQPEDVLRKHVAGGPAGPVLKFTDLPDRQAALDIALAMANATAGHTPLWLELDAACERSELLALVDTLAARMAAGELPGRLIVQPVWSAESYLEVAALQETAEAAGIELMAEVGDAHDADAAAGHGIRAVGLTPQRAGGISGALRIAAHLKTHHPDVRVGLSTESHLPGITARAVMELATALPRLDYCAVMPSTVSPTTDIEPPVGYADGDHHAVPGDGPGLGARIDWASGVGYIARAADGARSRRPRPTYAGRPANEFDIDALLPFASGNGDIRVTTPLIERAALRRGLDTVRLSRRIVLADHSDLATPLFFSPNMSAWIARPAQQVTGDKELTRQVLRDAGVPVPQGAAFGPDEVDAAVQYAMSIVSQGTHVVVKPSRGLHGTGVSTDLREEADVRKAITTLTETKFGGQPFVVESYVPGDDYRLLVVGGQVVSVVLKRPASVIGDGTSTIAELVVQKNRDRLENPHTRGCLLRFGTDTRHWLDRQGLTPESVPAPGTAVRLGSAGNIATGGESIEVLDETHPSLLDLAVRAVHAVPGLDHAGVDVMADHLAGLDDHAAAVIELNAKPATTFHHFPLAGSARDVSSDLVARSCVLAGIDPGPARERLALRIDVEGRVQKVGYRQWFARLAHSRGVVGSIHNRASGSVTAFVSGASDDASLLASCAMMGSQRSRVDRVTTTHVTDVHPDDRFEVSEVRA
ncbi:acylphosphatase [Phytoactinopolyspora halophila]|uniref:acylphosphatase n=1 Tax=Phytoactinopolyspora halophila TaxID=1981511 RepID=UPI00131429F8|nr:acylphosphatase [Phytoactinopolyspora halophila]